MSASCTNNRGSGIGSAVLLAVWLLLSTGNALAQQKHKFSFKAPAGATKYTQTHVLEVGDVPAHQVRVAELITKYPGEAPVYDGVKVTEARGVLISDYTDGSGMAYSHGVLTLENGDRIFTRSEIMTHTSVVEGSRRTSFNNVVTLRGGTGKFKGIRGTLRGGGFTDLKTGTSGTVTEGEYWFEK